MVKCILCLEYPTIPGPKFLDLFSDEGLRLGISEIINKHFWLKTYRNGVEVHAVCMTCWEVVRDFHILYQRVEEVHKHLEIKTIDIDDPLPQDVVMLKSEDTPVPMMLQDPIMSHTSMGDNLFDPEVKVEVNDLDLLPQIEIIETAPDIALPSCSSDRPIKSRRSRAAARDQSPKPTTTKRIKKETSPAHDRDDSVDVFAENEHLADDDDHMDDVNKSFLSSSLDVNDTADEAAEGSANKEVRSKRGRPRKSDVEKSKASTSAKKTPVPRKRNSKKAQAAAIKNEQDDSEEPSCSTAAQSAAGVSQIKTEQSVDDVKDKDSGAAGSSDATAEGAEKFALSFAHDDDDDDDDADFGADNDNDYAAKDSDDSSSSESDEDNDSDASDWVADKTKSEKFAVILKKERNTPKKYKKREKPLVEPKRMSKEEIAARQAQQTEYDNIITKFFEKLRCPKCELLVHTFGDMRAHFRLDHNDDHGFVECCGRRFATRKYLAEHIMVHYNPEHFKCKTCDKVCRDSAQLESHEQTHLPNPPEAKYKKTFQCEKCSKTFSSKASFEHHMVAKHVPREEFKFECPECKKKFPSMAKLKEHMNTHDPTKVHICDKCGRIFKNMYNMKKHEESEHSDVKPEPQQCVICNTWYRNMDGLKTHMKNVHENEGAEHRCHICNKTSTTHRALKRHIYLNHICEKKFKCTMCEKAFKRRQDLKEHISVHTGEALYTCPSCPMTFSSSANMYKHRQRLHKAEYAANKQQAIPSNIIKQAKSVPNTLRTKRRFMPIEPPDDFVAPPPPTSQSPSSNPARNSVLLNPQMLPIKFEGGFGYQQ